MRDTSLQDKEGEMKGAMMKDKKRQSTPWVTARPEDRRRIVSFVGEKNSLNFRAMFPTLSPKKV